MKDNYFRVLLACGAVSVGLLLLGTRVTSVPGLAMLGGILPLMYYHLGYLGPRAKKGGMGQSAIDSVYYFGFLVTIAALSISAIYISGDKGGAIKGTVLYQFGAGLLATAYAVIARMHLSSLATILDATSPEAIMDRYLKRSLELVDNAETANAKVHAYVQLVVQRTEEFDSITRGRAEKLLLETTDVFAREMKATLDEARAGLKEVRETANDLSMQTLRSDLTSNVGQLQTALKGVTVALDEMATQSRQSAQGAKDAVRTSDELNAAFGRLHLGFESLAGENGSFPRSVAALDVASTALVGGSEAMGGTVASLKEAADYMQSAGPAFRAMRSVSKKVQTQLQTLEQVTNRLEEALKPVGAAAGNTEALARGLTDLAAVLPPLTVQTSSLAGELGRAEESARRLNGHLEGLAPNSTVLAALSKQVEGALTQVAQSVNAVIGNVRELNGPSSDMTKLTQALSGLVTYSTELKRVVDGVQQGLSGLANAAQSADKAIGTSTQSLSTAMTATAGRIEADLNRSTEATSLLTNRLVQVAQTIIDRTRQQQGVLS